MKRLWRKIRCLLGFHDIEKIGITGNRVYGYCRSCYVDWLEKEVEG